MPRRPSPGRASLVACVLASAAAALCNATARAQDVLLDIPGLNPGDDSRFAIAVPDWNGDGVGDLAIGAPLDDTAAQDAGIVRIHSGVDGSVLTSWQGPNAGAEFGGMLVSTPDLDGDAINELAVGAVGADFGGPGLGSVFIYSGGSGALLRRIDAPGAETEFGGVLGTIGDVDGDFVADLFVGTLAGSADAVHVISGADGHDIRTLSGGAGEEFGYAVAALDDLDSDGVRDLLIGAPKWVDANGRTRGAAYVVSPATGAVLDSHQGGFDGAEFGLGVALLADLDADGVGDYAVSTDVAGSSSVALLIYSAAAGTGLAQINAPAGGYVLEPRFTRAGDLNGDTLGDFAISGTWTDAFGSVHGAAFLYSGLTLRLLDRIEVADATTVVAPFGDRNHDFLDELIVGSADASANGRVRLYAGDDLWLNATPSDPLGGVTLSLTTREGVPGNLTMLLLTEVDGSPFFLVVDGPVAFNSNGARVLSATVPSGLTGHVVTFRSFAIDGGGKLIRSAPQTVSFQ